MEEINWPKRFYLLDISRAIASIAVILWHWQHFYYNHSTPVNSFDKDSQPFYSILKIFYDQGGRGVQFFFLLSGFVFFWIYYDAIKERKITFKKFFMARFSRLYPLHILTLLIVLFLQLIYFNKESAYFVYEYNDFYHFILNLFFASKWGGELGYSFNGPVWSVSIEILLYLVFFIVALKKMGSNLYNLSISLLAFVITSFFSKHVIFVGLTSFFFGGVLFYLLRTFTTKKYIKYRYMIYVFCMLSWAIVFVNIYVINFTEYMINNGILLKSIVVTFPIYILFPTTVATLAIFEIVNSSSGKTIESLAWLGDITYSSYLLHFPLQLVSVILVSYGILNENFYFDTCYLICYFIILIPLSYFTFLKFEKPVQNWIRKKI